MKLTDVTERALAIFRGHMTPTVYTECWEYGGSITASGYGMVSIWRGPGLSSTVSAHRLAYMLAKGPIPPGYEIDHLCRNRACANPAHLEAVTRDENQRRVIPPTGSDTYNGSRSRCFSGHSLDDAYRYTDSKGYTRRYCRSCKRIKNAAASAKRRGVAA